MENLLLITLALIGICAALYFALMFLRLLFAYKITEKSIVILLFHTLPIYKIPLWKIIKMHTAPVGEVALIPGIHLFTRPFSKRVVIEMQNTWFRFAFLTPADPDAFIAEVKKHSKT